jgi:hypothetical protein
VVVERGEITLLGARDGDRCVGELESTEALAGAGKDLRRGKKKG